MQDVYFNELQFTDVCKSGFIAEEVGKIIPEAVEWDGEYADGLSTNQIIAYLTKVVQEQQKRIEDLERKISK